MLKAVLIGLLALVAVLSMAAPAPAAAAQRGEVVRYRATLTGRTLASGNADYREFNLTGTTRSLKVQIEDAAPSTWYWITAGGVRLGAVKTNEFGRAEKTFRTRTDDPPGPVAVPRLARGSVVAVGTVSGALR